MNDNYMTNDRYEYLMRNDSVLLTEQELKDGCHFCVDWDGLLLVPGMGEFQFCTCDVNRKVHNNIYIQTCNNNLVTKSEYFS